MATKPQIAVAITATDELSGVLDAIKKRMEVAGREAREFGRDLDKSLAKRGLSPGQLGGSVSSAVGRAGMIPGLGALAGAGSIAGVGEIVTRYSQMGVTLGNTARLAGVSAQEMNGLRGAARMVGLSADTADTAMTGLNETISAATFGHNNEAAVAFKRMGIDLSVVNGHAKRSGEVLPQIVEQIARIAKVDPRPARDLMAAIGMTPEALPLFAMGAQRLGHLTDTVQQLDRVTGASQESSARFTEAMGRMGVAGDGLARTIATAVEPHLTPLLNGLSTWVSSHGPDIGQTFDHLGKAIESVHWSDVGTEVERVGRDVAAVVKHLEDFGARMDRVTTNVGNFVHLVQTPGRVFYDALQRGGNIPQVDDMGRPIEGTGGDPAYDHATPRERFGFGARLQGPIGGISASMGTPEAPKPEQERRARAARDQLVGLGWAPHQAAGIVANLFSESRMNGGAVGDGGEAYGLAQWHSDRRAKIEAAFGKPVTSMSVDEQVRAVDWELRNNEKSAGDRLRNTRTAAEAGDLVSRAYERPRNTEVDASNRAASADAFDRRWARTPAELPSRTLAQGDGPSGPQQELSSFIQSQTRAQQGTVKVEVVHSNAPDGVTLKATGAGLAEISDVRTTRTMPARSRRDDG